jgi:DNA-binding SARP family transcriptional activator
LWFFISRKTIKTITEINLNDENINDFQLPKESNKSNDHETKESLLPRMQAIYLMGGFKVFDQDSNEISKQFTNTIRLLFTLITLYTLKNNKGISSAKIRELIWSDKTVVQARNNRNVNLKKLREALRDVGDVEIINEGDYWKVHFGKKLFLDLAYLQEKIKNNTVFDQQLINLIRNGPLLPAIEHEWLDGFRSEYSNSVIDYILSCLRSRDLNEKTKIELADALFSHDSINQTALIIKCQVLDEAGKYSLAKNVYDHFTAEYEVLYGEEFYLTFDEILRADPFVED